MRESWVGAAEERVLARLLTLENPIGIKDLVEQLAEGPNDATKLRIATMNLVGRGKATVDDRWQISAVRDQVAA